MATSLQHIEESFHFRAASQLALHSVSSPWALRATVLRRAISHLESAAWVSPVASEGFGLVVSAIPHDNVSSSTFRHRHGMRGKNTRAPETSA
jgi:CBS-domain-containing membrane protein